MAKLAVIGAGVMGLAAAHHALGVGHQVKIFEADAVPGGMAAHFDFDGISIERYYHFVCKTDNPTFGLMRELGIADKMKWRDTYMGYYVDGRHYRWGDPFALLTFPLLGLLAKFRYGLQMFLTTKARNFESIEHLKADDWFRKGAGEQAYQVLWQRLFELKFFELADNISASWIATRIKRIGKSRRSLFQEQLGYIEGGSETLIKALVDAIVAKGGTLSLSSPVSEIVSKNGKVVGVRHHDQQEAFDAVISTVPTPYVTKIVPGLSSATKERYQAIKNIGVVCVIIKLRRQVTRNFWLNINDPAIEIPGIIEFSNLRPMPETVVYIPYYMPHSHPKWGYSDDQFIKECSGYLQKINPEISAADVLAARVGRLHYAQPICEPNFKDKLPPVQTEIDGLQIADTCFYYPEDRGIAESVRIAKKMAENVK